MSSKGIFSSSVTGKNECELCKKIFTHRKYLLRHHRTIHGGKSFDCHLCPYKTARKDKLVSHQKVHTKSSSEQPLNRKRKTKTQLSSNKINLSIKTQQLSNFKMKYLTSRPNYSFQISTTGKHY